MSDSKWTKPNRLTEIVLHEVQPAVVGAFPGPSKEFLTGSYSHDFQGVQDGDTVWIVRAKTRTGLDKEDFSSTYFASEEEAKDAVKSLPVGTKYGDGYGYPVRFREIARDTKVEPIKILSMLFGMGDEDAVHFVCYEALATAGVISKETYAISPRVLEWLGEEQVAWMRDEFGENWSAVGRFEYCLHHFPRSSLVCLASELFLAQFVTGDNFVAGYLTKEIEVISSGTEEAALHSLETRKKAGKGGARASRDRRLSNLEIFLREIENLASAVGLFSEERILAQAFESAREREPLMPKSKKTREDYETTLRSEEPFKARYDAVFGKNT